MTIFIVFVSNFTIYLLNFCRSISTTLLLFSTDATAIVPLVFPQIFFILGSATFISAADIGKTTRSNRDYIDCKRKKKKERRETSGRIQSETRIYINRHRISIIKVLRGYVGTRNTSLSYITPQKYLNLFLYNNLRSNNNFSLLSSLIKLNLITN